MSDPPSDAKAREHGPGSIPRAKGSMLRTPRVSHDGSHTRTIHFTLNGETVSADIAPHQTWSRCCSSASTCSARARAARRGCADAARCWSTARAVSGCLYLAAFVDGAEVVTIEHLAADGKLTPVQEAFLECGAAQCGFCTPGFVLMAGQLLDAASRSRRGRDPALSLRQSLPLRAPIRRSSRR